MPRPQKEERLHFRVTAHQKKIIARAAELKGVTMTEFILAATYQMATEMILDQTKHRLTADKWAAIEAALDAPAQEISALREMANKYGHLITSSPQPVPSSVPVAGPAENDLVATLNSLLHAGASSDIPVTPESMQSKGADFQSASASTTVKPKQLAIA